MKISLPFGAWTVLQDGVRIVADASVMNSELADGRFVPILLLDTENRPDIEEYVRIHEFVTSGDTITQWAETHDDKIGVALVVKVVRPVEVSFTIVFDLERGHGVLVEQILQSRAVQIQSGKPGERVKDDLNRRRVVLEVMTEGCRPRWDDIYFRYSREKFKAAGANRNDAKRMAREAIAQLRSFNALRLPGR